MSKVRDLFVNAQGRVASALAAENVEVVFDSRQPHVDLQTRVIHLPPLPEEIDEKLELMMRGYLDHETGHLLFTDKTAWYECAKESEGKANLLNSIEDGRINNRMMERWYGCNINIGDTLKIHTDELKDNPQIGPVQASAFSLCDLAMGKTRQDVVEQWGDRINEWLDLIDDADLDRMPVLKSTREVAEITNRIWGVWKNRIKEQIKEQLEEMQPLTEEEKKQAQEQANQGGSGGLDQTAQSEVIEEDEEIKQELKDKNRLIDSPKADRPKGEPSEDGEPSEGGQGDPVPAPANQSEDEQGGSGSGSGEEEGESEESESSGEGEESEEGEGDEGEDGEGGESEEDADGESEGEGDGEGESKGDGDDAQDGEDGGEADDEAGEGEGDSGREARSKAQDGGTESGEESKPTEAKEQEGEEGDGEIPKIEVEDFGGTPDAPALKERDERLEREAAEAAVAEMEKLLDGIKGMGETLSAQIGELVAQNFNARGTYMPYTENDVVVELDGKRVQDDEYEMLHGEVRSKVSVLRQKLMMDLLARKKMWVRNKEEGTIDDKSLYRAVLDDSRIFKRRQQRRKLDTAISLVVDMSGSMSNWHGQYGGTCRMKVAAQLAMVFSETLQMLDVPHEVLGYTTNEGSYNVDARGLIQAGYTRVTPLKLSVVKSFKQSFRVKRKAFVQLAKNSGQYTIEGEAVFWAGKRLAERKESRKILIVLCDGHPESGWESSDKLRAHAKKMAKKVAKAGIEIMGVGIQTDAPKKYYPKAIQYDSLDDLTTGFYGELSRILKGQAAAVSASGDD